MSSGTKRFRCRDLVFTILFVVLSYREMQRSAKDFQMLPSVTSTTRASTESKASPSLAESSSNATRSSTAPIREMSVLQPGEETSDTTSFTVDLVSIGSQARPDYLDTQERTFAKHSSVRHFFKITEADDTEPNCTAFLNEDMKWRKVSSYCVSRRDNNNPYYLLGRMAEFYRPPRALEQHPYPAAWLCAQKRPIYGLLKAMRSFTAMNSYPDYLIIMDDDTYINLEIFQERMRNLDADVPITYGGEVSMLRITRKPPVKQRFFFAFGGFGLIFSRGVLRNLVKPIHCQKDNSTRTELERVACDRLDENSIGEKQIFQEGMSVLDLMEEYVNFQMFKDVDQWEMGYCLHSDWTLAYFITYYEVSLHAVNTLYYDDYRHARLQKLDFMEEQKTNPVCQENLTCCRASAICHYQRPDDLNRLATEIVAQAPSKYRGGTAI
jgi:hypothetical protein